MYFTKLHIELAQGFPLTNTQNKTLKIKFVKIPKGTTLPRSGKRYLVCQILENVRSCPDFVKMRDLGILKLRLSFGVEKERASHHIVS